MPATVPVGVDAPRQHHDHAGQRARIDVDGVAVAAGALVHRLDVEHHLQPGQGVDQRGNYPKGTDPVVLGESVNVLTTYGYDPVTGMQEPKATLCQVRAA